MNKQDLEERLINYSVLIVEIIQAMLRESLVCLKIIYRTKLFKTEDEMMLALNESNELISIFVKSVETAQKNIQLEQKKASNNLN